MEVHGSTWKYIEVNGSTWNLAIPINIWPTNQIHLDNLGPGTWNMGLGTWYLGLGTWYLGPGTWYLGPGTWDLGFGTWNFEEDIISWLSIKCILVKGKCCL